jgi:hypothetical protein
MSVCRSRCRPSAIRRPLSSSKRANQIAADFVNGLLRAEVAEFVVTGTLQRSAFGMTADRELISDKVVITINAPVQLSETFHPD